MNSFTSLTCFLMLMKSVISNGVSLHYRETLGISHRRTQSVSQKSFVLRVQPLWQTHHPWEGLTLVVPLHTVYLRGAAEAPSHPALRLILYNLWKMSHTQQHRTPLLPATPAHRTWQHLETWLWWRWHPSPQRRLVVERCLSVTLHPGLKMMELAPGCHMRPGGLFKRLKWQYKDCGLIFCNDTASLFL